MADTGEMNQRAERLGTEVQAVLSQVIARGGIRDSRVRGAGLVTITRVRVTGDLSEARVAFTVFNASVATLEDVRRGLQAARGYLQQELGRRLRTRRAVTISFEVDRSIDNAFRIDGLLREDAARHPAPSPDAAVTDAAVTDNDQKDTTSAAVDRDDGISDS